MAPQAPLSTCRGSQHISGKLGIWIEGLGAPWCASAPQHGRSYAAVNPERVPRTFSQYQKWTAAAALWDVLRDVILLCTEGVGTAAPNRGQHPPTMYFPLSRVHLPGAGSSGRCVGRTQDAILTQYVSECHPNGRPAGSRQPRRPAEAGDRTRFFPRRVTVDDRHGLARRTTDLVGQLVQHDAKKKEGMRGGA
eukprot:gene8148-biopygen16608